MPVKKGDFILVEYVGKVKETERDFDDRLHTIV